MISMGRRWLPWLQTFGISEAMLIPYLVGAVAIFLLVPDMMVLLRTIVRALLGPRLMAFCWSYFMTGMLVVTAWYLLKGGRPQKLIQ